MTDIPVKAPARPVLRASAMRANGADYIRTYHHVSVSPDITVDDILRPAFWAHHTNAIRPGDLIDILSEDFGLDMQVRVTGKGQGFVNVRPLRVWERDPGRVKASAPESDDAEIPEGYVVNFAPKQKWRVMTKDPHDVIAKDIESKAMAIEVANAHYQQANGA